ncbi:MAG: S8 family serine peptidase [Maribacter sp.]
MIKHPKLILLLVLVLLYSSLNAQKKKTKSAEELKNWYHSDLTKDSIPGISTERAIDFLKNKSRKTVVVGVIDSSIDIHHEDLNSTIWKNIDEIEDNGVDDDKNGYIDDINGWNFAGNLKFQNYEYERIIMNPSLVADKKIIARARKEYDIRKKEAHKDIKGSQKTIKKLINRHNLFSSYLDKENYTLDEVFEIKSNNSTLLKEIHDTKQWVKNVLNISTYNLSFEPINTSNRNIIIDLIEKNKKTLEKDSILISGQSLKSDLRKTLGDNLNDLSDHNYGDNKINFSTEESHGTHVSGIIAANRENKLGVNGVCNSCLIMPIRLSGSGDEHDKDVALSIRYAVDNGAKIINASFGKNYSINKNWVYEAIKYAEKKDVLIVVAAGNDNLDLDSNYTYPNDTKDLKNEFSNNVIVVGASSFNYGKGLATIFSNYGKRNVDIFAPGFTIYSSAPNNTYLFKDGTSMAAPIVTGIAGLIRSYYPTLTAKQVKQIILESGTKIDIEVIAPGSFKKKVLFSDLCSSSSIANAYYAVKIAEKLTKEK